MVAALESAVGTYVPVDAAHYHRVPLDIHFRLLDIFSFRLSSRVNPREPVALFLTRLRHPFFLVANCPRMTARFLRCSIDILCTAVDLL